MTRLFVFRLSTFVCHSSEIGFMKYYEGSEMYRSPKRSVAKELVLVAVLSYILFLPLLSISDAAYYCA